MQCPCQSGCPTGCPCEEYVCPTTTTSAISTTSITTTTTTTASSQSADVLILNTYNRNNVPIITNASGREDSDFNFSFGKDTEVYFNCGLTWRGEFYIFGGSSKKNQISKIQNCQLKSVGQLAFSHHRGGCANVADNVIYLCFNDDSSDWKKCRMASSPLGQFSEVSASIEKHCRTRIAAGNGKLKFIHLDLILF